MGGTNIVQRHQAAAAARRSLEEGIRRSLRASEAVNLEIEVLEHRLKVKRKGASPEKLRAAAVHHERIAALKEAQAALDAAPWEEKSRRRAEVDRLRALIEGSANTGHVSRSGGD